MLKATIYLDDVVFSGIDLDGVDNTTPSPAFRSGFHCYGAGQGRDVLMWGGESFLIESRRNISSYLKRILDRIDDGTLPAGTIRIEFEDRSIRDMGDGEQE